MITLNPLVDMKLGYVFLPPCHPNHLCHRQLDINLQDTPTLQHYDPEVVQFMVASDFLGNSVMRVRHPWEGKEEIHAVVGTVIMEDRFDKVVEAFTFGGDLQISSKDGQTKCSLISKAPILPLLSRSSIETVLAEEVEIILAERREVWDEAHKQIPFEQCLAEVDPFILYLSCLKNLQEKFSLFPKPLPEYLGKFVHFLRMEIKRLQSEQLWPLYVPDIEKLL